MSEKMKRPERTTDEQLLRLDALRADGVNMFGAYGDLMVEFELERDDAILTLLYWMINLEGKDEK